MDFSLVKQAMEIKSKMEKAQKELAKTILEVESKNGAVKVTVNGQQKVLDIKIAPEAVVPEKTGELEKTVLKTVQDAHDQSQKMAHKKIKEVTGGFNIPGLT